MKLKNELFEAFTTRAMAPTGNTLPLSAPVEADLKALLAETDSYVYLAIKGCTSYEVVKAYMAAGSLVVDRGQAGTSGTSHAPGATVYGMSPLVWQNIKDLICQYDCCEGECVCNPVTVGGIAFPTASLNTAWTGFVVFEGDGPIVASVNGQPSWMTVELEGHVLKLYGTPNATGTTAFSVSAANCGGKNVASQTVSITVS